MTSGGLLFSRYAYPPNSHGYCGPDKPRELLEHVAAGVDDGDLRHLAKGFEGAWPYLELIAGAAGIGDPLDARVVEAYWIGNPLLDQVSPSLMGGSMEERFRARAGRVWPQLIDAVPAGALPHHSFHVFGIYPWLGLLRSGRMEEPLHVLDQCRIRWGQVVEITAGRAMVRSRPLSWDGRSLGLGEPRIEEVVLGVDGLALTTGLQVGDWCSLHWDWICDRLSPRQLRAIQTYSLRQLRIVNGLPYSAPASVLS